MFQFTVSHLFTLTLAALLRLYFLGVRFDAIFRLGSNRLLMSSSISCISSGVGGLYVPFHIIHAHPTFPELVAQDDETVDCWAYNKVIFDVQYREMR